MARDTPCTHNPSYFQTRQQQILFFLNPIHGLYWLLVGIGKIVARLPYAWQLKLGKGFGKICYVFGRKYRDIVNINLSLCFPRLADDESFALLTSYFRSAGIGVAEMIMAFWKPTRQLQGLLQHQGLENLQQAYARGKGVILLSAHFTMLEICMRLSCEGIALPFHVVYRKQKNAFFNYLWVQARNKHVKQLIEHDDIRSMLSSLKQGNIVCYVPDQDFGRKYEYVFAPFFGVPAATITSTSRLSEKTGAAVVLVTYERLADAQGYAVCFHPPLQNFPTGDRVQDAQQINAVFESAIRNNPDQYFWHHRRFKTRPAGEQDFYRPLQQKSE